MKNEEAINRVKEQRNVLRAIKSCKANCIGYILHRNCLLKHFTEGQVQGTLEVAGRPRRRGKQLLYDLEGSERIMEIERGSTRSRFVENSRYKKLWTCRKTDY